MTQKQFFPPETPSMRDLMPDGFLRALLLATGCKQRSTISDVVLLEQTTSKYWPAVVALARETDPLGFAQWKAAHAHAAQSQAA
jgi:hypothetical protein